MHCPLRRSESFALKNFADLRGGATPRCVRLQLSKVPMRQSDASRLNKSAGAFPDLSHHANRYGNAAGKAAATKAKAANTTSVTLLTFPEIPISHQPAEREVYARSTLRRSISATKRSTTSDALPIDVATLYTVATSRALALRPYPFPVADAVAQAQNHIECV